MTKGSAVRSVGIYRGHAQATFEMCSQISKQMVHISNPRHIAAYMTMAGVCIEKQPRVLPGKFPVPNHFSLVLATSPLYQLTFDHFLSPGRP